MGMEMPTPEPLMTMTTSSMAMKSQTPLMMDSPMPMAMHEPSTLMPKEAMKPEPASTMASTAESIASPTTQPSSMTTNAEYIHESSTTVSSVKDAPFNPIASSGTPPDLPSVEYNPFMVPFDPRAPNPFGTINYEAIEKDWSDSESESGSDAEGISMMHMEACDNLCDKFLLN
jgi:hypothetical protein